MAEQVTIARRFRGPADSGNGGYACGALARFLDPSRAEVTLRLPPPLDRPLDVERGGEGRALLRDGEALVAEARRIGDDPDLAAPRRVGVEEAEAARRASPLHRRHPFAECFVCGPERRPGDGLGIVCGPVDDEVVAAPWRVDRTLPGDERGVAPEVVWAALDCPGGLAGMLVPDLGVTVLGRLAVRIHAAVEFEATYVAVGRPVERDGRKLHAGSALFSPDGEPVAEARATWIELRR